MVYTAAVVLVKVKSQRGEEQRRTGADADRRQEERGTVNGERGAGDAMKKSSSSIERQIAPKTTLSFPCLEYHIIV